MFSPEPQPRVVYVERRGKDHGCLIWTILLTLVLGPFGLLLGASAGITRGLWRGLGQFTVASARGAEAFTRRYGVRGWLIVGAVLVALAIVGALTQGH